MAIDDILDEHEQSERVLEWLRRNGAGLIGGILLGMAAIGGWKWWEQHQEQRDFQLADQYQMALDAIQANDEQAGAKVKGLGASVYATLAALQLAEAQVAAGQRDAAVATLRAAPPSDPAIAAIVDQRLARLLLDAGQAEEALKLIGNANTPSALELLGDARYALGQRDQARDAYVQALRKQDPGSPRRRLLELKLTEVGGAPAQTEAKS
jgi:predicted negative regulator of RcsB-dependent stress response